MHNPLKISVITVCRNCEKTITDTLNSVLSQTYPNVEHIVIDGLSTDDTMIILNGFKNKLAYLISEPDKGIYDAMNKGIKIAKGDIICFLNADDVYSNNDVLQKVADVFLSTEVMAVYGDVSFFRSEAPDKIVRTYNSGNFKPSKIPYGWMPAHQALFIRHETYIKIGEFKTNYKIAGDFEWIARAFYTNKISSFYIHETLTKMRMGGVSTGGVKNTVLLNQEVKRACDENDIKTNWFKILSKYPKKIFEFL